MRRRGTAVLASALLLAGLAVTPAHAQDAQEVDDDLVGCGTDQPELTVNLVGRRGGFWFNNAIYNPNSAYGTARPTIPTALEYTLGATLAPGDYEVFTISVDDHLGELFRVLFGVKDEDEHESYGLAFDYGGPDQVVTPGLVADLPTDLNWQADVPLATPVPLSWSIGPNNPLFPQIDPVTPGPVLAQLPGFPLGAVSLTSAQDSVWAVHEGVLAPGAWESGSDSIVPYFATFRCTEVDDCDDNYSDTNTVTMDPSDPGAGDVVTLTSEGFEPGVTVDIVLEPAIGPPPSIPLVPPTAVIAPDGTLDVDVTLPDPLDAGIWTIKVISQKCAADQGSVDFTIGGAEVLGTGGETPPAAQPASSPGVQPVSQVQGATQTSGGGALATTGTDRALSLAGLAVGLLGLGGVLVMASGRHRRRSHSRSA